MTSFFEIFSQWLPGMIFIMFVYHISAYFFTKDKNFLLYSFYLLLSIICVLVINNAADINTYRASEEWLLTIYIWMLFGWFFIRFLNVKKYDAILEKIVIIYILINTVFFTTLYIIDYFFLESRYFFYFSAYIFLPTAIIFISFAFIRFWGNGNRLGYFYSVGFLILAIGTIDFFMSVLFFNKTSNYQPENIMLLSIFLEVIIISVALGYQYDYYRKKRTETNQKIIKELQINEQLISNYNKELSTRIKEVTIKLEEAFKKTEDLKLSELKTRFDKEKNQLDLASLLSNMNAHFIFNTLNSIKLLIVDGKQKKAAFYLNKFSKLIRGFLNASTNKKISLAKELETMNLYTVVENLRFENQIFFNFKVDSNVKTKEIMVPPLVLHPFLENAIWHGVSSKKGEKIINVKVIKDDLFVIIIVEDNGIGRERANEIEKKKSIKRTYFGVKPTKERLLHFYQGYHESYSLKYIDLKDENNNAIGTKFILKIPLKNK